MRRPSAPPSDSRAADALLADYTPNTLRVRLLNQEPTVPAGLSWLGVNGPAPHIRAAFALRFCPAHSVVTPPERGFRVAMERGLSPPPHALPGSA
jgi:hypothetical protein